MLHDVGINSWHVFRQPGEDVDILRHETNELDLALLWEGGANLHNLICLALVKGELQYLLYGLGASPRGVYCGLRASRPPMPRPPCISSLARAFLGQSSMASGIALISVAKWAMKWERGSSSF